MDLSLTRWLSRQEMDVEPSFIHQSDMGSLYDTSDSFEFRDFCSESYLINPSFSQGYDENPTEKRILGSNCSLLPTIISFGSSSLQPDEYSKACGELKNANGTRRGFVDPRIRSQVQEDHVLAERKRRERMNKRLVALSALIPGLKKLDKASVLEDAIKHIKHLQERVERLGEQVKEINMEPNVVSSSDESWDDIIPKQFFPEIKVRVLGRNVLIRIDTKEHMGQVVKMLYEIENLHLSIVSSNVMTFSNTYLIITAVAQIEAECCMTANDMVKKLRRAIMKF